MTAGPSSPGRGRSRSPRSVLVASSGPNAAPSASTRRPGTTSTARCARSSNANWISAVSRAPGRSTAPRMSCSCVVRSITACGGSGNDSNTAACSVHRSSRSAVDVPRPRSDLRRGPRVGGHAVHPPVERVVGDAGDVGHDVVDRPARTRRHGPGQLVVVQGQDELGDPQPRRAVVVGHLRHGRLRTRSPVRPPVHCRAHRNEDRRIAERSE